MATRQIEVIVSLRALDRVSGVLGTIGGRFTALGKQLRNIGTSLSIGLTLPLSIAARSIVKTAGDFEQNMKLIEIASRSTADEMRLIEEAAFDVGRATGFGANEASKAMIDMFKSGLLLEEILGDGAEQAGILEVATRLAAASNIDLEGATAALITTMKKMGLEWDSATMIADSFVAAADASVLEVDDLVEAWKNAGKTLQDFGLSVNDINLTLAVLGQQGIIGAEAGTRLRRMLTNMTRDTPKVKKQWDALNVSLFDANGAVRPLIDVIGDLRGAMSDMNDEQKNSILLTLAGSHGRETLSALLAAEDTLWGDVARGIEEAASAQKVAEERVNTFQGASKRLSNELERLKIKVGIPLIRDFLTPLTTNVIEIATRIEKSLTPEVIHLGIAFGTALAVIGPLLFILGALLSPIGVLTVAIATLATKWIKAQGGIHKAMDTLREKVSTAFATIKTKVDEFKTWYNNNVAPVIEETTDRINSALTALKFGDLSGAATALGAPDAIVTFFEDIEVALSALSKFWEQHGDQIVDGFGEIGDAIAGLLSVTGANGSAIIVGIGEAIKGVSLFVLENGDQIAENFDKMTSSIANFINTLSGPDLSGIEENKDQLIGLGIAVAGLVAAFTTPLGPIAALIGAIAGLLVYVFGTEESVRGLQGAFNAFIETVREPWNNFINVIKDTLDDIGIKSGDAGDSLRGVGQVIAGVLAIVLGIVAGIVSGLLRSFASMIEGFNNIREGIGNIIHGIVQVVSGFFGLIVSIFTQNKDLFDRSAEDLWKGLVNIARGTWQTIKGIFQQFIMSIILLVGGFVEGVITFFTNLYQELVGGSIIPDMLKEIFDAFVGFIHNTLGMLGEKVSEFLQIGRDLLQGFWDGLTEKWAKVKAWLEEKAALAATIWKKITGSNSPSKVFADIGRDLMAGLQIGMESGIRNLGTSATQMAQALPSQFENAGTPQQVMQSGGVSVAVYIENISSDIDVELMARKVAQVIVENQRVRLTSGVF